MKDTTTKENVAFFSISEQKESKGFEKICRSERMQI